MPASRLPGPATRSTMARDAVSPGESMPAACTRRGCRRPRAVGLSACTARDRTSRRGQSPALVLSRMRAIRSAAVFGLDDPLADLREVFRVGDVGQGGGQTRGGAGVELAGRLTAEQAAFLAAFGRPSPSSIRARFRPAWCSSLQLRERFGLRRPELR